MRTRMIAALVVLSTGAATVARAERFVRPVTDVATVERLAGGSQIFFQWDPTIAEGDVAVRHAVLRFNLQGEPEAKTITLRVHPVTAPWSRGLPVVYDEELWSHKEVDLRLSGAVVMDLTTVVKEIAEEGVRSYGFLVEADAGEGDGLTSADLARLAGLSTGIVEVTWRRTPAPPVDRDGGSLPAQREAVSTDR